MRFSDSTGFRLCGIAEEPFWPGEKYSSASRTSVRCRWRISVASRSTEEATTRERGEIHGVAVARDHLRRDRLGAEAEGAGDVLLDPRIDIGEGADGAGDGRGRDLLARGMEAAAGAGELGIGIGELDAEGRRLGMDAVAAADRDRVLVLVGAPLAAPRAGASTSAIRRSAARTSWRLKQVSRTSDEVRPWWMKRASGPTISARWVRKAMTSCLTSRSISSMRATSKIAFLPFFQTVFGGGLRHDADLGHGVERMRLDLEPDAEAGLRRPDRRHFGSGVARDHRHLVKAVGVTAERVLTARKRRRSRVPPAPARRRHAQHAACAGRDHRA